MAVDSSQLNSASRDAYWQVTQAQLKSAQTDVETFFRSLGSDLTAGFALW